MTDPLDTAENAREKREKATTDRQVQRTRTLVVIPSLHKSNSRARANTGVTELRRSAEARGEEAVGLAEAINLDVIETHLVNVHTRRPATLLGKGKVEDIAVAARQNKIELVIVDHTLTPVQQRNLEEEWKSKVLDRTGLILEIFGERAQTSEGRLQVELAHLNYQKGRLVRSWTHLERQRGGVGFLGGPGETQIESDRRQLQEKIRRLEKDLDKVRRTRGLHRKQRKQVPHPIVALVGYTNAGKSTLFNYLTDARVFVEDLLFATLDPTLRTICLPKGREVILSDTVGFISDLPTDLVAAFRATLEEVLEANLILHVRDIAHEDTTAQAEDVYDILRSLKIEDSDSSTRIIEIWNKVDLLDADELESLQQSAALRSESPPILISALKGTGLDELVEYVEKHLASGHQTYEITLQTYDGARLAWLYQTCEVMERSDSEDGQTITVNIRVSSKQVGQLRQKFPDIFAGP
ncbi:MAG: GTPase HflX [Cohaesibacteraceae bacterium]|nr:GTPase HflX [Cohaesibacteraceae bacterium]